MLFWYSPSWIPAFHTSVSLRNAKFTSMREATNTAVVKAGDFLLLLNDDAKLTVARSSRSQLEVIQRYTVGESATWAQPAVSGNRVFIKDVSSLGLWTLE